MATKTIGKIEGIVDGTNISFFLSTTFDNGKRTLIVLGDGGDCARRDMTSDEYDTFVTQLMAHSRRLSKFLPVTGRY